MKACVYCKHCEYEKAYHYSERTWGAASWDCAKNHWLDELPNEGKLFIIAQNCTDFELTDEIVKLLPTMKARS